MISCTKQYLRSITLIFVRPVGQPHIRADACHRRGDVDEQERSRHKKANRLNVRNVNAQRHFARLALLHLNQSLRIVARWNRLRFACVFEVKNCQQRTAFVVSILVGLKPSFIGGVLPLCRVLSLLRTPPFLLSCRASAAAFSCGASLLPCLPLSLPAFCSLLIHRKIIAEFHL